MRPALDFRTALPSLQAAAARRVGLWVQKRQGIDGQVTTLTARRVYILPTGIGIVFGVMTFAMLLGAMNYNNNLAFGLTFLLAGLGFVSMHGCQRNLVGLELAFAGVEPVFAGDAARFRVALNNRSRSARYGIWLSIGETRTEAVDLEPGDSQLLTLDIQTTRRGRIAIPRFGVRTRYPFELFRAWAWLHLDVDGIVYPALVKRAPSPPPSISALGHRQHDARGEEDFAGLRRFHRGDSPRNVAWKAYARSGQLLTKQFSGADTSSQWFDFDDVREADVERRLSILTRWIVDADRRGEDYGLRLRTHTFPPAHGSAQRLECLEALALFGEDPKGA